MGSTLPCPLHDAPLLTSRCVIFLLGPNPPHRSRSWVSSGTKGKASKNCRYTCTKIRAGLPGVPGVEHQCCTCLPSKGLV